ncbi:guanylate cyclase [filamentous cyanobacterium CCP5]|nr:guanylate cyclase [filamentous cyanobacterium CCP5]
MRLNRSLSIASGKLSLRSVLVASFVLQITAAVGLTTWLSFRNTQRSVNYLANQISQQTTARIEDHLDTYLGTTDWLQSQSQSLIQSGDLNSQEMATLANHFWHQLQAVDHLSSIYFAKPSGEFIGIQRRDDGQRVLWSMTAAEVPERTTYRLSDQGERLGAIATQAYDPRTRPWYQQAVAARQPIWSPIYRFASQDYPLLGITPAVPVFDPDGELSGVLAIDLTLEQLSEFLKTTDAPPMGESFVIERSGAIVASSTDEAPFMTMGSDLIRLQAADSTNPLVRTTGLYLQQRYGSQFSAIRGPRHFRVPLNQDWLLVQVNPFLDERGLDWLIVTVIPEQAFVGPVVANTRTTALLCLLSLAIAALIAMATARWVVSPIFRLNNAAQQLAVGNWHQPLPQGRFREVAQLADAFRRMASQLKISFQTLESQNAELQRYDRLKDEFLANTTHELKTPLNGMIGLAESLLDGATGPLPRRTRVNLNMIVASGRRLTTLVNDLLDFSQLRHRQVELRLAATGVREVVDVVLTLNRPLASQQQLQLVNAVSPRLPAVLADEDRLQQILQNLISNAVKFTHSGMIGVSAQIVRKGDAPAPFDPPLFPQGNGTSPAPDQLTTFYTGDRALVAVPAAQWPHLAVEDTYVAVTVSDTGIGIATDQLERIFYPFEQGDGNTGRIYGGMGIGLAVTRQLVELHGGTIWVSSALGAGSQFTFTLPIATEKAVSKVPRLPQIEPESNGSEAADGPNLTVISGAQINQPQFKALVVDDDRVNRQVIINHLCVQNYQVIAASNGPKAMQLIHDGLRPDIILLDVMMPGMTGYEVCRAIRETYAANELPVIMLTAKNQVADLVEGLAAGANDYITKPVSKNELLARIKTHLHLSKINLAYGRFVPREFLQFLHKESIVEVQLGDQVQQHMSVMFADILDFTSLSERMDSRDNFAFINAFLSRMEPAIAAHHGFIDKYIGDAIMALFSNGGADNALSAAIDMLNRLHQYNQERIPKGYDPIAIGIGINTGELRLGTVGGCNRMDSTVISDTVNVAARIERLTRLYQVSLFISHHTFLQLGDPNQYAMRVVDRVRVKGKNNYVSVYEVFDADPEEQYEAKLATKTAFETALLNFYQDNLEAAIDGFTACQRANPRDLVVQVYLDRCHNRHIPWPTHHYH